MKAGLAALALALAWAGGAAASAEGEAVAPEVVEPEYAPEESVAVHPEMKPMQATSGGMPHPMPTGMVMCMAFPPEPGASTPGFWVCMGPLEAHHLVRAKESGGMGMTPMTPAPMEATEEPAY